MTIKNFIRQNRQEIDEIIIQKCPNVRSLNDKDRQQWILNDEGLYSWARNEGVRA